MNIETILAAYLECALWATTMETADGSMGDSFDSAGYTIDAFPLKERAKAKRDIRDFVRMNRADLEASNLTDEQIGHDFWLTREGHGAGFWDRGLGPVGQRLTESAKIWGGGGLYLNRGRVYFA